MHIKTHLLILFTLLISIHPVFAEVMDKEPTSINIWFWTIFLSIVGFILCRYKPLLGIFSSVAIVLYLCSILTETLNPQLYRSIIHEAGLRYTLQLFLAFTFTAASHISGVIMNKRKMKSVPLKVLLMICLAMLPILISSMPYVWRDRFAAAIQSIF